MEEKRLIFEDDVRSAFAGVVWTHKIHEKQAEIHQNTYRAMEIVRIASSAMTSAGIFSLLFIDPLWVKIASSIVSFVTLCINSFLKSFDEKNSIIENKQIAVKVLALRDEYNHLLMDIKLDTVLHQNHITSIGKFAT